MNQNEKTTANIEKICPQCQTPNPGDAPMCGSCGEDLANVTPTATSTDPNLSAGVDPTQGLGADPFSTYIVPNVVIESKRPIFTKDLGGELKLVPDGIITIKPGQTISIACTRGRGADYYIPTEQDTAVSSQPTYLRNVDGHLHVSGGGNNGISVFYLTEERVHPNHEQDEWTAVTDSGFNGVRLGKSTSFRVTESATVNQQ